MHEMSLCDSVMQTLREQAKLQGFQKVVTVYLEIGELALVEPESLTFAFDILKKETLANEARLEILIQSGQAWCDRCNAFVSISRRIDPCPECGVYGLRVTGGEQLRIKQLEVQ